jgi:hypothetical protein
LRRPGVWRIALTRLWKQDEGGASAQVICKRVRQRGTRAAQAPPHVHDMCITAEDGVVKGDEGGASAPTHPNIRPRPYDGRIFFPMVGGMGMVLGQGFLQFR